MTYFSTRDIAAIAIISALWGAMNDTILPIFFTIFNGIPFLCEMVALTSNTDFRLPAVCCYDVGVVLHGF